ncbi:MAG: hypothetical protein P8Q52_03015, partial [Acidimicrobiales bacterium]|nr:hypothetical protein [Acidimicrobiales bacterium]
MVLNRSVFRSLCGVVVVGLLAVGCAGADGEQGPAGADGEQGPAGADGEQGPAGADGEQEAAGADGEQGPAGAAGPKGDTGSGGPKGDTGDTGSAGPAGPSSSTDGSACTNAAGVAGTVVSGADSTGLLLAYCLTSPVGTVTTFAGGAQGSADGTGADARFNYPKGVAVDGDGNLYVADSNNHTVRKITLAGEVTTLAGTAGSSGSVDGTGADARFNYPHEVAVDGDGNLYVADTSNHTIRKITPAGVVTTLAGTAGSSGSADGTGADARFTSPNGVAVDGDGNVYVADTYNYTVRKVTPAGVVTTLAGTAGSNGSDDGTSADARFKYT